MENLDIFERTWVYILTFSTVNFLSCKFGSSIFYENLPSELRYAVSIKCTSDLEELVWKKIKYLNNF